MLFSVVIPVYNKAEILRQAVESLSKQTFQDFEIVIVNDGSKDNFSEAVATMRNNPRIQIIEQANAGVSVARNVGIQYARGEFICFLDADDLYFENHLSVLHSMINAYPDRVYFATSHITIYPDQSKKISSETLKKSNVFVCENLFDVLNRYGDGLINTNSMCIKKSFIVENDIFFQPGERIGEDTDMWFRVALRTPLVLSQIPTTAYRREYSTATAKTSNSFTWIFARRIPEIQEMPISSSVKKACFKLIDRYKMTCSRDFLRSSDKRSARNVLKNVKYKTIKYWISWLLCLLPLKISKWLIARI